MTPPTAEEITGIAVALTGDDAGQQKALNERMAELGLTERARRINEAATPFAAARIAALLGAPRIATHDALVASVVRDLERALPSEDEAVVERLPAPPRRDTTLRREDLLREDRAREILPREVLGRRSASDEMRDVLAAIRADKAEPGEVTEAEALAVAAAYAAPRLGEGLERLAATKPQIPSGSQVWVGTQGRALELDRVLRGMDAAALPGFAEKLAKATATQDAAALEKLIDEEG